MVTWTDQIYKLLSYSANCFSKSDWIIQNFRRFPFESNSWITALLIGSTSGWPTPRLRNGKSFQNASVFSKKEVKSKMPRVAHFHTSRTRIFFAPSSERLTPRIALTCFLLSFLWQPMTTQVQTLLPFSACSCLSTVPPRFLFWCKPQWILQYIT